MAKPNLKMEIFCPIHGVMLTPLHSWHDLRDLQGINQSELDPSITHYTILTGQTAKCRCKWLAYGTQKDNAMQLRMLDQPEIPKSVLDCLARFPKELAQKAKARAKATCVDITRHRVQTR